MKKRHKKLAEKDFLKLVSMAFATLTITWGAYHIVYIPFAEASCILGAVQVILGVMVLIGIAILK